MSSSLRIVPARDADEVRTFPLGRFELFAVSGQTVGRAVYRPGWRWSEHIGAQSGAQWCEVSHVGYVVAGQVAVRMRDGTETAMAAGDWFVVPPGHDSWVIGDEDYESIHLVGAATYAAPETASTTAAFAPVAGDRQPAPVSSRTVPAQSWDDGCLGWTLLDTPTLHVMEETMPAGTAEQPHQHSQTTQLYYMTDGSAVTRLGGAHVDLVPGTAVVIPPGSEHQLVNHGDKPNRFLVISSSPPRADRLDSTLAGPPRHDS
jgi:quercetin dioxygenase-like cupin family protein